MKIRLLFVDDEEQFLESMRKRLEARGFDVACVTRGADAIEVARERPIDIALVDLKMPGISGEETLDALKREHPLMEVVILTGHGSVDSAVECTRAGAYGYLQKPCDLERILEVLTEAYTRRLAKRKEIKQERIDEVLRQAVGESPLTILRRLRKLESED